MKSCELSDLEIVYKDVQEVLTVTENGEPGDLKETISDFAEFDYYRCNGCGLGWKPVTLSGQEGAWEEAKDHLTIEAKFKEKLQTVYGDMQRSMGIDFGDIDPITSLRLEEAENALAEIVGPWLRRLKHEEQVSL
jgi:hypothetical protein